jgi:hypothetical protein
MLRLHSHMLEFPLMKVLLESLNKPSGLSEIVDLSSGSSKPATPEHVSQPYF